MGADGYIEVARVVEGHEQIDFTDPGQHVFRVREPVAVLPVFAESIAPWSPHQHTNFRSFSETVDAWLGASAGGPQQFVRLGEVFAILVVPRIGVKNLNVQTKGLGGISMGELTPAWDRLVNGFWCVLRYHDDVGADFSARPPDGVKLDVPVTWRIWT